MKISRPEVEKVAHLARLSFDPDELDAFTTQLNVILDYVEKLGGIDTSGIEPTFHSTGTENVFRQDVVQPSLPPERSLGNAPERENDAFVVPRII